MLTYHKFSVGPLSLFILNFYPPHLSTCLWTVPEVLMLWNLEKNISHKITYLGKYPLFNCRTKEQITKSNTDLSGQLWQTIQWHSALPCLCSARVVVVMNTVSNWAYYYCYRGFKNSRKWIFDLIFRLETILAPSTRVKSNSKFLCYAGSHHCYSF